MIKIKEQPNNNNNIDNNLKLDSLKTGASFKLGLGASFKLDIESKKKALLVEISKTTGTEQDEPKARYGHLSLTDENCNKFPELKDIREKYNEILKLENADAIKKSKEELLIKAYDIMHPETKVKLSLPGTPIDLDDIKKFVTQWASENELTIENLNVKHETRVEGPSYPNAGPNWQGYMHYKYRENKTFTTIELNVVADEEDTNEALKRLIYNLRCCGAKVESCDTYLSNPKEPPLFPKELL